MANVSPISTDGSLRLTREPPPPPLSNRTGLLAFISETAIHHDAGAVGMSNNGQPRSIADTQPAGRRGKPTQRLQRKVSSNALGHRGSQNANLRFLLGLQAPRCQRGIRSAR